MVKTIGPLIAEQLGMSEVITIKLLANVTLNFEHIGILNEGTLLFVTKSSYLPVPQSSTRGKNSLKYIMVFVTLLLSKIANIYGASTGKLSVSRPGGQNQRTHK